MSGTNLDLRVGDVIITNDSKLGIVRFIGEPKFASGVWYGIELKGVRDTENGTDGTKDGNTYFTCAPKAGFFLLEIITYITHILNIRDFAIIRVCLQLI